MPLKLFKRKGGAIWYMRGTVAGQRIYESTGLGDKRAAEILRARREAEIIQRHAYGRSATLTFAEAAVTYMQTGGETRFLRPILEHFGPKTKVAEIDNDAVNACATKLYPKAAPATINRQVVVPISAVVNLGAETRRTFNRRKEPKGRLTWLTPEEAERLLNACAELTLPRHSTPERFTLQKVAFLLGTGCRAGECFAAEVKDWNPGSWQWWIPGREDGAGKTVAAERMVRLPARTVELIGDLPEVGRAFRTPYGHPIVLQKGRGGQMQTAFNKARDAAGLGKDITPHVLRHTWATWFYAQTRDFGQLIDLGGWEKADTANRYRKIAPDDLAERLLQHGWDFTARPSNPEGTLHHLKKGAKSVQSRK